MTSGKQHSVILMTYFDKSGDGIPDGTKGLAVRPSPVRVRVRVGIGGGVDVASDFRDDFFLVTLRMIFVLSRFLLRSSPVLGTEAASRTEPQCLIAFLADERFFSFGSLLYFPSFSLLLFLSLFCSFLFFSSAFLPSFLLSFPPRTSSCPTSLALGETDRRTDRRSRPQRRTHKPTV